jgi:transcriptional regulator with XRE-family HTH domain
MKETAKSTLDHQIASRVRTLRVQSGSSIEALAARSGVSRSMISVIERGESSATAVILDKLATGLGVPLASLFDAPNSNGDPVARLADQVQWRDPTSGYLRRNVSPSGFSSPTQIVEVRFPAGARIAYETAARQPRMHQQVWLLEGRIEIAMAGNTFRLDCGDCLAMVLDQPVSFRNPTRKQARYAVIITVPSSLRSP